MPTAKSAMTMPIAIPMPRVKSPSVSMLSSALRVMRVLFLRSGRRRRGAAADGRDGWNVERRLGGLTTIHRCDDRHDQQCHDVDDLDERIDRRSGRILVGIADRITRDRGLVRIRAFAAVVAFFDVLLRVVP